MESKGGTLFRKQTRCRRPRLADMHHWIDIKARPGGASKADASSSAVGDLATEIFGNVGVRMLFPDVLRKSSAVKHSAAWWQARPWQAFTANLEKVFGAAAAL